MMPSTSETPDIELAKQVRPLPFQNFRNYRRLPVTHRNLFMAAVAAHFEETHAENRSGAIFKYGKRWLTRVPREITRMVWHHSSRTRELHDKSLTQQMGEILRLYLHNGIGPDDYYRGDLASVDRQAHEQMVPYWMYRDAMLFCMQAGLSDGSIHRIRSKSALAKLVKDAGHNAPKTLAFIEPTDKYNPDTVPGLEQSFFVKPDRGSQGEHAERWVLQGDVFFLANQNRTLPKQNMFEYLIAKSNKIDRSLVVQELIENNDVMRLWAGKALATARIMTCRPPNGNAVLGAAMLRMPACFASSVDNIALGGRGFHIEPASGLLNLGYSESGIEAAQFSRFSPVTGAEITGSTVPGWDQATSMVKDLHETLSDIPVIGWDVGFAQNGPTVVEANVPTGINPPDQVKLGGFFTWTAADCMAQAIAIRLKETLPAHSRLLVGADYKPDH